MARSAQNSGKAAAKKPGKPRGRPWPKGVSGNPGGRPKSVKEVQELASTYTVEAVEALVDIMRGCRDAKEVRQSAIAILNRACGMPSQPITGVPGAPLTLAAEEGLVAVLRALAGEPDPKAE